MNISRDSQSHAPTALPHRSWLAIIVPIFVIVATAGLVAWTAWPTLMPVRQVEVTQAVFDRSANSNILPVSGDESDAASGLQTSGTPTETPTQTTPPRGGKTVQAPGWLEAEPFYVAATALADGVIKSIDVLEGDKVNKGQVIARMIDDDSKLRVQQAEAELATAQSDVLSAQATLTAAQQNWNEPIALERAFETSQAAVAEAQAELAQLPALIQEAQAESQRFDEELELIEESHAANAASETELIVAKQRAAGAKARVTSLQAREPLLQAKVKRFEAEQRAAARDLKLRIEDRRMLDDAKAALARAKANVALAQARHDEAKLELERMTILSPITGIVQERMKVPGDKIMLGSDNRMSAHVVHLYDPDRLQVRVDVPLADASNIYVGQRCEVVVDVLPDQTFEGKVLRITHLADLQKNTLEVKVQVINPSPLLRPDMLTRVKFLAAGKRAEAAERMPSNPASPNSNAASINAITPDTTVLVPSKAIIRDGERSVVWFVANRRGNRGVARRVTVEAAPVDAGWQRVRGQVQPGALLILDPSNLRENEPVQFEADDASSAQTARAVTKGATAWL